MAEDMIEMKKSSSTETSVHSLRLEQVIRVSGLILFEWAKFQMPNFVFFFVSMAHISFYQKYLIIEKD